MPPTEVFFALLCVLFLSVTEGNLTFLIPQTDCRVTCQNGGACAYVTTDPEIHKCMCLVGMYEGDYCETKVSTSPPLNNDDKTTEQYEYTYNVDTATSLEDEDVGDEPTETSEYLEATQRQSEEEDSNRVTPKVRAYESRRRETNAAEFTVEESDDGWMMVKRSKSRGIPVRRSILLYVLSPALVAFVISLYYV
jgi:hypothetical protein